MAHQTVVSHTTVTRRSGFRLFVVIQFNAEALMDFQEAPNFWARVSQGVEVANLKLSNGLIEGQVIVTISQAVVDTFKVRMPRIFDFVHNGFSAFRCVSRIPPLVSQADCLRHTEAGIPTRLKH